MREIFHKTKRDFNTIKLLKNKGLRTNEFGKSSQNGIFKKRTFELD